MKHVKKYNTGIIYECLLKEISSDYVDNKNFQIDLVFHILERHFLSKKAPLKREASFFALIEGCEQLNENQAHQVLRDLETFAKNTDIKKLNEDKNNLINEVEAVLGKKVLDHKLENYKILATIEQLLEHYRDIKSFGSALEKVKLENEVVSYLTSQRNLNEDFVNPQSANEGLDKFTIAVAMNNMKKKYETLSEEQMLIIKESVTTKDINKVKDMEQSKINEIKIGINNVKDESLKEQLQNIVNEYKPIENFSNDSLVKTLSYFELSKTIKA